MAYQFPGPAGYSDTANAILGRYGQISAQATAGLRGSNQAELLDIYDQYLKAGAQQKQGAITAGLRNTTKSRLTTPSTLLGQKWRAEAVSNSALARSIADYEARIGLAEAGAAGSFLGQGSQLALNYAQLAQQAQLTREGFANQQSLAAMRGGGGGGGGSSGGGGSRGGILDRKPWGNLGTHAYNNLATGPMGSRSERTVGGNPFYAGDYGYGGGGGYGDYGGGGNFYDPYPGGGSGGYAGPDSFYYPVPVAQGPYGEPEPTEGPPPNQGQGPGGPSDYQYYLGNQWVWDSEVPYDNGSGGGSF